jgi:RNA polymerase sigma factor (sigma-70 family)
MASQFEQLPADRIGDLIRRVRPRLKSLLAKYRIPLPDTEDLLQETFTQLVYQQDRIREQEAWLLGTLRHQCRMYWRTHRRRLYSAVDNAIVEALSPTVEPEQERDQLVRDLQGLIDQLPCRCRSVLTMRFRHGYEPNEVADLMRYSRASIGKITTRCLADLRRKLLAAEGTGNGNGRRISGCAGCLAADLADPEAAAKTPLKASPKLSSQLSNTERSRRRR